MAESSLINGTGLKRYGMGLTGLGAVSMFAPPSAGDEPLVLFIKLLPSLAPILVDGAEKILVALTAALAEYSKTKNAAAQVVERVTAVVPPAPPSQ
jgi:hypothetical protein